MDSISLKVWRKGLTPEWTLGTVIEKKKGSQCCNVELSLKWDFSKINLHYLKLNESINNS